MSEQETLCSWEGLKNNAVSLSSSRLPLFGECFFFFSVPIDIECAAIELRASDTECSQKSLWDCSRFTHSRQISPHVKCGAAFYGKFHIRCLTDCQRILVRVDDVITRPNQGTFPRRCKIIHEHPWPMRRAIWTMEASSSSLPIHKWK